MVADFPADGVVQLTSSGWFAVTVEFRVGALIAWLPGYPTTTPCTLSVPFTTERVRSPDGSVVFDAVYWPEPVAVSVSATSPPRPAFVNVTVAPLTFAARPS